MGRQRWHIAKLPCTALERTQHARVTLYYKLTPLDRTVLTPKTAPNINTPLALRHNVTLHLRKTLPYVILRILAFVGALRRGTSILCVAKHLLGRSREKVRIAGNRNAAGLNTPRPILDEAPVFARASPWLLHRPLAWRSRGAMV